MQLSDDHRAVQEAARANVQKMLIARALA